MSEKERFQRQVEGNIDGLLADDRVAQATADWYAAIAPHGYTYNFTWMGVPVIQFPQDLVALQEIVWSTRPDLIVETGVARGGSMVFYASLLELLGGNAKVMGIDIDIRPHNREVLDAHPLRGRMELVEGSSIDASVAAQAAAAAQGAERVMVVLDSHHAHDHVLRELELYAPLVTRGCYLVVCDTLIEDMDPAIWDGAPWGKGDNPKTAVGAYLQTSDRFVVDERIDAKLQISVAPGGYLRCVSD